MKNAPMAVAASREAMISAPGVDPRQLFDLRENAMLYSAVAFDNAAIPAETVAFNYAIGQTISGAGNGVASPATNWHTNLRVPRTLPSPEVFVVDRVRLHMAQLQVIASGYLAPDSMTAYSGSASATPNTCQQAVDLLYLQQLHFRLEIENKRYADAPAWMFPSNVGVGGVVQYSGVNAVSASTKMQERNSQALHWAGEGWRFSDGLPPVVTSNTVIDARLLWQHPGTAPSLQLDRIMFVMLNGRHGRSVR